jgi:hypothetical protein
LVRDAEQRQKIGRHVVGAHTFGRAKLGQRQIGRVERTDRGQRSGALAPCLEGGIADRSWGCGGLVDWRLAKSDERIGIRERRRGQQHGVDHGEDRRACAERQRQRQDRCDGAGR